MLKRSLLTAIATLMATAPASAHFDPVAHGTGSVDHRHAFIGIEPFVFVAVIAVLGVAGGLQRARAAARKRKTR